jgi:hypothetical protein
MNRKTAVDLAGAGPGILAGNCRPAGTVATTAASTLTMFSVLRPFPDGEADTDSDGLAKRQINAIRSWARLSPHVQLILFVERRDPILDRLANETGAEVHVVVTADGSPPKLDEVFAAARRACKSRVLMYSNGDMIYFPALLEVAHRLANESSGPFLAIGQRTGLDVGEQLDGNSSEAWSELELAARSKGKLASLVCKDFFLFPPELFSEMPPFRVGRGNWDNWMVWNARRKGIPVIDLTNQLLAVHQEHGYGHLAGGRRGAYLSSREARENRRLAGGRHLLAGSTSEWELTEAGISRKKERLRKRIADIPRFLRLLRDLLFVGYFVAAGSL